MRYQSRLCTLFQREWTPIALCRVILQSSPFIPSHVDSGLEVEKLLVVFAYSDRFADDLQTKYAPVTGFIDRAFGRNSKEKKKGKYCLILNRFHVFSSVDIWVCIGPVLLYLNCEGGGGGLWPDKIQTSDLVQIYQYPFLLSSGKHTSPPVGLLWPAALG